MVKGLRRLDDPACFPRWAYQVVTRRSTDWVRQTVRQRRLNERVAIDAPTHEEPNNVNDDVDALRTAIRKLPAEHRTLLAMHYLDGLSLAEIAEALGIPRGTVKSRLHAIRGELKGLLELEPDSPLAGERGRG